MTELYTPLAVSAQASGAPRAMVYVRDSDSEGVVRQSLTDLGVGDALFRTGGIAAAVADLKDRPSPRLLIVDVSGMDRAKEAIDDLIGLCEPSTGIVLVGESNDIALYRQLKEAGAAEYFFKPLVTALVSRTCAAVLSGQAGAAQPYEPGASRLGKLVLVVGARGGCGATLTAVRTAWRLAEHPPRPVVLVDLDLKRGDAALQLEAIPNHALRGALEQAHRVDDLFLERGIIEITPRLDLLASLEPLDESTTFEEDAVLSLLDTLRRRYRYVVVEVPLDRLAGLRRVLHLPSLLMIVSDAGLASAREVARLRQLLGGNTAERTTMHVLNKHGAPGSLTTEEFTRGSGAIPDVVVPWSREIAVAGAMGVKIKPECAALDRALAPVFARLSGERIEASRSSLSKPRSVLSKLLS